MANFPVISKRAYEERVFLIDLRPRMRAEDMISSQPTVESTSDAIAIDQIKFSAAGTCEFRVSGGNAGETYPIVIRFTTPATGDEPAQRLEAEVHLNIVRGTELP